MPKKIEEKNEFFESLTTGLEAAIEHAKRDPDRDRAFWLRHHGRGRLPLCVPDPAICLDLY